MATIWIGYNFQTQKRILAVETIWENAVSPNFNWYAAIGIPFFDGMKVELSCMEDCGLVEDFNTSWNVKLSVEACQAK